MLTKIKNWLLPGACVLCSDHPLGNIDLCEACYLDLPWLKTVCSCCAQPLTLTESSTQLLCGACLQQPPFFNRTFSMFVYQEPIKKLITGLKFQKKLIYAKLLGELLTRQLASAYQEDCLPECIIPVPLHQTRLRERGFNQAVELARPIANKFKIKIDLQCCRRVHATTSQAELPAQERYANVKNAFRVKNSFKAKHVALLDDVMTTGHTINELSKVLRQAGVRQIDVWCSARTNL